MVRSEVCFISGTRLDNAVVDAEESLERLTPPQHILADILTIDCRCSGYPLYPPCPIQREVQACSIAVFSPVGCSRPGAQIALVKGGAVSSVPSKQMALISNLSHFFFF